MSNKSLSVGDLCPSFSLLDQHGKTINSSNLIGKQILVIYFYPKDDTPGCTAQACNLRDNYKKLIKKGIAILGVSVDSVASHVKFIDKYELPFSLIADEDKKIVDKYNLWGQKKFMGKTYMGTTRTTFLIDEAGMVQHIIEKPDTKDHTAEILAISGW